jgi:hypothetical protein
MQKRNLRGAKQMTHEPIHTVHLTPHITWQGTQAELEAMQAEGWPLISAGEIIAAASLTPLKPRLMPLNLSATFWRQNGGLNGWQDGLILAMKN